MHLKRVAGIVNLIAAVIFFSVGISSKPVKTFYIVIAVIFGLLGFIRLRQNPPAPPNP